jgi:hypothetical protein
VTAQLDIFAPARPRAASRKQNATRYIHRLEITNGRVHTSGGFQVRIRKLGIAEWFGDSQYNGDRAKALRAAMRFRNLAQHEGWRPNG